MNTYYNFRKTFLLALLFFISYTYLSCQSSHSSVNITDYGYEVDSRENVIPAIKKAIENNSSKSFTLVFPKGRYDFWPDFSLERINTIGFDLNDLKNITIDGDGSQFIFHGNMQIMRINRCENIEIRNFRVDEILNFDRIYNGIDWGFYPDPFVLIRCHYDRKRRELYIFEEFTVNKETNESLIRYVKQRLPVDQSIIADCASPKDILDFQNSGISIEGSIKGKDSVKYGIDFLKDLNKIIIDPVRCPLATEEFSLYELILDRTGEVVLQYPDKNNHTIDAIRYALQWVMPQRGGLQILSSTKTYNDVLNTYSTKMLVSGADKNFGTVTTNAYRSVFDD